MWYCRFIKLIRHSSWFLSSRPHNECNRINRIICRYILFQLKEKKKKLKNQLTDLRDENSNLQTQIEELTAKLQNGSMLTKNENMNASCSTISDRMDDIIKILETRTATQMSNDGVSFHLFHLFWIHTFLHSYIHF